LSLLGAKIVPAAAWLVVVPVTTLLPTT
jgi:hypothetical protein